MCWLMFGNRFEAQCPVSPCCWKSHNGFFQSIRCDDEPIVLDVRCAEIDGKKMLFWRPCSRYVDYDLIEEFLDATWPKAKRTDATNFHNAF